MAFLAPLVIPALQALGFGGLTALGSAAVKKVIGDAVPEDQQIALLTSTIGGQMDPSSTQSLSPQLQSGLMELKTAMGAAPTLFFSQEALAPRSAQGFLNQPLVSSHSDQRAHSALSQTLSDAAALSQLRGMQLRLQSIDPMATTRDPGVAAFPGSTPSTSLRETRDPMQGQQLPGTSPASWLGLQQVSPPTFQNQLPLGMSPDHQQGQTTSSTLSMIPGTNLLVAPQPINKLQDNQAVLTERPPAAGTQNPVAQGISGVGGSPGLGNIVRGAGTEIFQGVKEAGQAAASQAVSQISGTATDLAKKGLTKAGGYLGSLISSGLTSIAKKIIGDAPPGFEGFDARKGGFIGPTLDDVFTGGFNKYGRETPMALASNVDLNKIVGDAPPGEQGEVMTDAQAAAATTNLTNSVKFNMMSRIILNEQTLTQSSSLPRGMSELQLNNFFARDLESLVGTYKQSEVQALFGFVGMTCQYNRWPAAVYTPETVESKGTPKEKVIPAHNGVGTFSIDALYCTGVALETARVAPPCTPNVTLSQLGPLLAGAALGEYSSQLRVKTFSTDMDLMIRASAEALNNIQSQQGYSFCLPLTKAIGYVLQCIQLFGSEFNELVADMYFRPTEKGQHHAFQRAFPLETLAGTEAWEGDDWQGAKFAVVCESDFIKVTCGIISGANWGEFQPAEWGHNCAVVFIPNNDKSNQLMNAVRMISQMAYPAKLLYIHGKWAYFSREGELTTIGAEVHAQKKAGLTRIPGPYKYALFVVMGAREQSSAGIIIGDGSGQANHQIEVNAIDHNPTTPYVCDAGINGFSAARNGAVTDAAVPMWMAFIKEWEVIYGNASDRSSAMRFWADNSILFGNFFLGKNPLDIGDLQGFSFLSWADPVAHPPLPSCLAEYTDLPVSWSGSCKQVTPQVARYLMSSMKTASYMPVASITPDYASQRPWTWGYGNPPDGCRLPYEDVMISFLVNKKWISPNEEYPAVSLDDAARLGHTITAMANIMAAAADILVQERDFTLPEVIFPPLVLQRVPMAMMRQKNVLWPALEELLTNGISYPQYWNNRDVNMHCWEAMIYWEVAAQTIYPETVSHGSAVTTSARIPVSVMGQWFAPLYPQYFQLRLNLQVMSPQRTYISINNVARAMFKVEYAEETTGLLGKSLSPVSWLMWRLSLGVIISDTVSANNGWIVQCVNNGGVFDYYIHMEQPDASRNQVMCREYGAGNVTVPPTTKISLPTGEFILKRSIATGLQPFSLLMQGPRDAFIGVGTGSTAYQMFTQTNTPQAIFVSETWATIPDWLFSPAGLQSVRDSI
ncbi:hypothetical protein 2 [Hubei toti-like virus 16]|uniref:hypothetical protein 2 n=1 Tax=Hubei toti-like virus 16 TaxID=1923304 RepID=UPI000909AB46|nr:hypothetical protein 2 [Hubei toti-like virus 16]APG76032.1 hypothetical protein 2 [Hubei toti-like virus 16]